MSLSIGNFFLMQQKKLEGVKKIGIFKYDEDAKNLRFLWLFFPTPYVKELCGCLHY